MLRNTPVGNGWELFPAVFFLTSNGKSFIDRCGAVRHAELIPSVYNSGVEPVASPSDGGSDNGKIPDLFPR